MIEPVHVKNYLENLSSKIPTCGIYQIRNVINNKVYIGSSIEIYWRWSNHKYMLKRGNHSNIYLQNAWNKYGEENFEFKIIEDLTYLLNSDKYEDNLLKAETDWIFGFAATNEKFGYNFLEIANKPPSRKGVKYSKEHCEKMSLLAKGRKLSLEACQNISNSLKGHFVSDDTKEKISITLKGKMAGEKNPMYGRKGDLCPSHGIIL